RGFRIEPGEVEAALAADPRVREARVVARGPAGDTRLVAYAAPRPGASASPGALLDGLRTRLPDYMVPAELVLLDALPRNANGKVDTRALPLPDRGARTAGAAPRTPHEELVAGIWAEVLGMADVGADESFFALGGHSLLATRVVSRVRRTLGVEVPLRVLFEAPTVAAFAARVQALRSAAGAAGEAPIPRVARGGPLTPSYGQRRLWIVDRLEPGSTAYVMPGAVRLRGPLDVAALGRALDALAARHEPLRTRFDERGGEPVQVIDPPSPVPLPVVDLGALPAAAREDGARRVARARARRPFDLRRGPLLRCTLLRLGPDDHVLLFTLHHVVTDGWSMGVLVRELSALYAAGGAADALPPLPVQYADFAAWQRETLAGAALESRLAYWRGRLAGAPPLLDVPTDRPRRAGTDPRAGRHAFGLSPELTEALRALSRREGATLFMTLLAAWQGVLGRWAGEDDVVVGTAVAGRARVELEGLVGFFVNMLPLRGRLDGDPTWAQRLARVRETALEAYAHQDAPFERLVDALAGERSLAHAPLFQVTFALVQAGADDRLRLDDVEAEPFAAGDPGTRYDLELEMVDGGGPLGGTLAFRAALFDPATAARMTRHLETVLRAMAADPAARASRLSLLDDGERARVLDGWNATDAPYPAVSLHGLVARQAGRAPGATALVFEGDTVSYGELERRAGRLARRLRRLGVGPETRVGVCAER
ncbi:condensation domain-containing protein, partial [Longimicrobium sp.]|uniref:condensation domain-containing protein n=1 Tax=Longimicrobium sp. TaxID=2029185 RepID=UPI002E366C12